MSTRGAIGFRETGDKRVSSNVFCVYNHYDSYYSNLGKAMMELYKNTSKDDFMRIFKSKTWINKNSQEPSFDDFFSDKESVEFNDVEFFKNSLMCEYAYLYNLETDELEVYKGCMKEPSYENQRGKFVEFSKEYYYTNCVLVATRDNIDTLLPLFEDDNKVRDYIESNKNSNNSEDKKEDKKPTYTINFVKKLMKNVFEKEDIHISKISFSGVNISNEVCQRSDN